MMINGQIYESRIKMHREYGLWMGATICSIKVKKNKIFMQYLVLQVHKMYNRKRLKMVYNKYNSQNSVD